MILNTTGLDLIIIV